MESISHHKTDFFKDVLNDKKYLLVNSERAVILRLCLQIHVWHELSKSSMRCTFITCFFLLLSCQAQQY